MVRASTWCYPRFTLAKDSSLGFASTPSDYSPCSDSLSLRLAYRLTSPQRVTSRLIMQKARGQALPEGHSPPTACKHAVSGSISLPSQGFFSPFPHGTSSLSVAGEYLALGDGPPRFPQGSTCPVVLGNRIQGARSTFTYGAFTLYGRPFQTVRLAPEFVTPRPVRERV